MIEIATLSHDFPLGSIPDEDRFVVYEVSCPIWTTTCQQEDIECGKTVLEHGYFEVDIEVIYISNNLPEVLLARIRFQIVMSQQVREILTTKIEDNFLLSCSESRLLQQNIGIGINSSYIKSTDALLEVISQSFKGLQDKIYELKSNEARYNYINAMYKILKEMAKALEAYDNTELPIEYQVPEVAEGDLFNEAFEDRLKTVNKILKYRIDQSVEPSESISEEYHNELYGKSFRRVNEINEELENRLSKALEENGIITAEWIKDPKVKLLYPMRFNYLCYTVERRSDEILPNSTNNYITS